MKRLSFAMTIIAVLIFSSFGLEAHALDLHTHLHFKTLTPNTALMNREPVRGDLHQALSWFEHLLKPFAPHAANFSIHHLTTSLKLQMLILSAYQNISSSNIGAIAIPLRLAPAPEAVHWFDKNTHTDGLFASPENGVRREGDSLA